MFKRKTYSMQELLAADKSRQQPNQLHLELLSVNGLNPFAGNDSSARAQMMSSHLSQILVIEKPTKRIVQTGAEREFGKYTYNIKMPCDGVILHIVDRYEKSLGKGSIDHNPEQIIIYEDDETKMIGAIRLVSFCTHSDYFGFSYKKGKHQHLVKQGARIPKDAVFLESPSIDEEGDYRYGAELNVAFMTDPATSEDSIKICVDVLERFNYRVYESIMVEWGRTSFPLNLYGDDNTYKPFPDIGDVIRKDGLLMAVRENKVPQEERNKRINILAPIETSVAGCQEVDFVFDKTYYVGGPDGKVIDVKVHHDTRTKEYTAMDEQALKYDSANRLFSQRLVDIYNKLKARQRDRLVLTPMFHKMIVEALSVCNPEKGSDRITKIFKQDPIDRYMVEFVVEYIKTPSIGAKFTDLHGGEAHF
jgi:DNA-directed RNA polymerase beta subunit